MLPAVCGVLMFVPLKYRRCRLQNKRQLPTSFISICSSFYGFMEITEDGKFCTEMINYVLHVEH